MRTWSWILGFIGSLGVLAFLAYAAFVDTIETPYAVAGGASLALVAAWIAADWKSVQRTLASRGMRYSANAWLLVVVVGAIVVAANVLASRYDDRVDLTASKRFSLSEQTLKVVAGLDQDVTILGFFPTGSMEESAFRDLVDGYTAASDRLEVRFHDPVREPLAAEQNDITSSWGTVVLKAGEATQRLEGDFGEEGLTNALIRLTSGKEHVLCAVTGHGELDVDDEQDATGLGGAVIKLEAQNYTVRNLSLVREGAVSADCEIVLVADPQTDLLPPERELLAAYVAGGGGLLVMLDPTHATGFAADLDRYGIKVGDDIVVESNPTYQLVGGDPTYLVLDSSSFAPHALTEGVTGMAIFRVARSVGFGSEIPGVDVQVLARTTPYGWGETTLDGVTEPVADGGDIVGNVPLIALAQVSDPAALVVGARGLGGTGAGTGDIPLIPLGQAAGALPAGALPAADPPAADPPAADPPAADPPAGDADVVRVAGGRVLVFGDSDFAANELLAQGNNQDLFLNAIAWMVGEDDQVSIRPNAASAGSLSMTLLQGLAVWLLCLLVVPGIAIGMALWTWVRRRTL